MVTRITEIVLAGPRGFCAGVERAIDIVELALEVCGPPVYVRREIVHNGYVVDKLRAKETHTGDIAAGPVEACNKASLTGSLAVLNTMGNGCRRSLG